VARRSRVDLRAVEEDDHVAVDDQVADVLVLGQGQPLRVDELQLAGRADQLADLVLVRQPGHLDHDPATAVAADLGPDLGLGDADAADAALDDVARRLQLPSVIASPG
jgi:hypothetical protein